MRRSERQTSPEEAKEILKTCQWGVLSLTARDGTPYGVPVNYVYYEADNALYFHSANVGKKSDAIASDASASFAVVAECEVLQERYTTAYRSAIAEGTIRLLNVKSEKRAALRKFCDRLIGKKDHEPEINFWLEKVAVFRFEIAVLTGKKNF